MSYLNSQHHDFEIVAETGDVNKNSGQWYELTVSRPYIFHGSIGPSAAVAKWEKEKLTVWTHSQGVFQLRGCLLYTSPSPRDATLSRMPSSA